MNLIGFLPYIQVHRNIRCFKKQDIKKYLGMKIRFRNTVKFIIFALILWIGNSGCSSTVRFAAHDSIMQKAGQNTKRFREGQSFIGQCSYYASNFHGRQTANGEIYNMHAMTAAHRTLPFGTLLTVENLANGKKVTVRVNDRGPFKKDRILDVSLEAARRLGMIGSGTARVKITIVKLGKNKAK